MRPRTSLLRYCQLKTSVRHSKPSPPFQTRRSCLLNASTSCLRANSVASSMTYGRFQTYQPRTESSEGEDLRGTTGAQAVATTVTEDPASLLPPELVFDHFFSLLPPKKRPMLTRLLPFSPPASILIKKDSLNDPPANFI